MRTVSRMHPPCEATCGPRLTLPEDDRLEAPPVRNGIPVVVAGTA